RAIWSRSKVFAQRTAPITRREVTSPLRMAAKYLPAPPRTLSRNSRQHRRSSNMRKIRLPVLLGLAVCALMTAPAWGQAVLTRQSIPRTADGKPDFTGVWAGPGFTHRVGPSDTDTPRVSNFDPKNFAPFKAGGEARFMQKETGEVLHDDPTAKCLPDGFPREALAPYPTQILQYPGVVIFLYEYIPFFPF